MKPSTHKVNTVQAKNQFNGLVAEVNRSKEPIVIERRGNPVAVILDYEQYLESTDGKSKKNQKKDTLLNDLKEWHTMMDQKYPQGTGLTTDILKDIHAERHNRDQDLC